MWLTKLPLAKAHVAADLTQLVLDRTMPVCKFVDNMYIHPPAEPGKLHARYFVCSLQLRSRRSVRLSFTNATLDKVYSCCLLPVQLNDTQMVDQLCPCEWHADADDMYSIYSTMSGTQSWNLGSPLLWKLLTETYLVVFATLKVFCSNFAPYIWYTLWKPMWF